MQTTKYNVQDQQTASVVQFARPFARHYVNPIPNPNPTNPNHADPNP